MSAPDTDPAKQAEQHKGPLTGMTMAVLFAAVLLVALLIYVFARGGAPEGAATTVDGRTGATESSAPASDAAAPTVAPAATTGADQGAADPAANDTGTGSSAPATDTAPATNP